MFSLLTNGFWFSEKHFALMSKHSLPCGEADLVSLFVWSASPFKLSPWKLFLSPSYFFLSPWYFSLSAKKKFVTNFVTAVTNFLTHVTNFVIRVTKFVTKTFLKKGKNIRQKGKNISGKVRNIKVQKSVRAGRVPTRTLCCQNKSNKFAACYSLPSAPHIIFSRSVSK